MCGPFMLHLSVPVDEKDLRPHGACLREFLKRHNVAPKAIYNAELVLEEMVGNAIRYGKATGKIRFSATVDLRGVLITITDNGLPFDPTAVPGPDIPLSAGKAGVGGLGIYMVRRAVDEMVYHRIGWENRLEIRIDTRLRLG
jgi:anti-sigma regulatory factor (Ser/Thr protein kinase)